MLTELGKYLRTLRSGSSELLKDMAEKLDMSPAMLSSVENGNRNVPKNFAEKLTDLYSLTEDQKEKLLLAIARTRQEVSLSLEGMSSKDQSLAFSFARRFSDLDEESKRELQDLLSKGGR